jgi:hypothetical protein
LRKRTLALVLAAAVVAVLAVGMGGTAPAPSAAWPAGRIAAMWPAFSTLPRAGARWNGLLRRCIRSARVQSDYRCEYSDAAGRRGYACVSAGSPLRALSQAAVTVAVAPGDPTYRAASPAQVCDASLAYSMSLS